MELRFFLTPLPIKANILIDKTGNALLADFGLVAVTSDSTSRASSLRLLGGTLLWTSPELIDPERFGLEDSRPTKQSDCYALGMVIYEIISGHLPFHKCKGLIFVVKILAGERPLKDEGPFTDSLWEMLELCWMPQPDARPSIEDVLQCLEGASIEQGDNVILGPAGMFSCFILLRVLWSQ